MGVMLISTEKSDEMLLRGVRKERDEGVREMYNKRNECNLVPRVSLQRKGREKLGARLNRMLNSQPTTNVIHLLSNLFQGYSPATLVQR